MERELIDKVLLTLGSVILFLSGGINIFSVIISIAGVTFMVCSILIKKEDGKVMMAVIYIILCLIKKECIFFLPIMNYDLAFTRNSFLILMGVVPFLRFYSDYNLTILGACFGFSLFSVLLKQRTEDYRKAVRKYERLESQSKEAEIILRNRNREILKNQDYEINLGILDERNRIAREIHDSVGHKLSSGILQIGALIAVNKQENMKEPLNMLKDTMLDAMNSIRASVHDLYDDSIDFQNEIEKLVNEFQFCAIQLEYGIQNEMENTLKFCFIAIVKEALNNVIKHSNAVNVWIRIKEFPEFYQLVIKDNGNMIEYDKDKGIGLQNMEERVRKVRGTIRIDTENGFRIAISVKKEKKDESSDN
jgi:signal transduction histidine kinase